MNHEERNLVEILRRIDTIERKIVSAGSNRALVSYGTSASSVSGNDHRLLSNLNSEDYMHLTGDEYRSLVVDVTDHGHLTGLLDNDHPQYIRHGIAGHEWDMLAATINANGTITFSRKSIDDIRNKVSEKLFPNFDSVDAMGFYKSDGSTPVLIVDTLHSRVSIGSSGVSIGKKANVALDINGDVKIAGSSFEFVSGETSRISSNTDMKIHSQNDLALSSQSGDVVLLYETDMRSETFAKDTYGWSVKNSGDAFFRNVKVNKINARIVSTGVEQYIGGRQTMCKSASPLTDNFTVPAPEAASMLHVEPFADYPYINVFDDGDIVRLVHINLYDGKYNTSDCWGTVVFDSSIVARGEQVYTFTRSASPNSGSCKAGDVIPAGELVLNFGVSGDGYIVSTVV